MPFFPSQSGIPTVQILAHIILSQIPYSFPCYTHQSYVLLKSLEALSLGSAVFPGTAPACGQSIVCLTALAGYVNSRIKSLST